MLLQSPWTPWLTDGTEPLYQRLAAAIAQDIGNGCIAPGARLPAHRDLSHRLGIGLGTVTKAYGMLERQGLATSVHGRGMFVSEGTGRPPPTIDLSVNVPPNVISQRLLSATLGALADTVDTTAFSAYEEGQGIAEHRVALASWLRQYCAGADAERMTLCNGGQHALWCALTILTGPGVRLACDEIPFPGLVSCARMLDLSPAGLRCDSEGIMPDALEACARNVTARGEQLVLYANPIAQNPTGRTMSMGRMHDITKVCVRYDVTIVEDDVYAAFAARDHLCFLDLVPERTFYINSLAKLLTPGLRLGILIAPTDRINNVSEVIRAQGTASPAIASLITYRWIVDGVASHLAAMTHAEALRRSELAAEVFADRGPAWIGAGFHMFLPMPRAQAAELAQKAGENGIIVTPPALSLHDPEGASGVRLCLGEPPRAALRTALECVAALHAQAGQVEKRRPPLTT